VSRWPAFWTRGSDAWAGVVVWSAGVVIGLASERAAFGWDDFSGWIPDLVVGLVFIGCGVQAMTRDRGTAVLLMAVGFTWFLGNFWTDALFLHRGLLVHLLVTYPGWRPRSRLDVVLVTVGYVAAVFVPVWRSEPMAIVLACVLVVVVARGFAVSAGRLRRARRTAFVAGAVFGAAVVVGAVLRSTLGDPDTVDAARLLYQAALCCVAFVLTAGLPAGEASSVVDLVVELGETRSGTLRDALAMTLGDPKLEVGYWDRQARYLDAEGRVVVIPAGRAARSATFVERGSQPFAVVVHDAAILGEPALVEAVASATRLSTLNAELQTAVRAQLTELAASRRRLVYAADEERRRLDNRLREGAEHRLRELDELLRCARPAGRPEPVRVGRARALLSQTIDDLRELAEGLHPRELDGGLASALESLAARSPVPVTLVIHGEETTIDVRTAIFYVCGEALVNVIKHAAATTAAIRVTATHACVEVEVTDDGAGGADAGRGSGLGGLIDRVEALDGSVRIDSPLGGGTRLTAEIPIARPEPGSVEAVGAVGAVGHPAANRSPGLSRMRIRHDVLGESHPYGRSHRITRGSPR
jgi:signal transduction histidine kinase